MTDVDIDLDGVPRLMEEIGATARKMQTGLEAGAQYLKSQIAVYPPSRHGPQPFKNDKQRRGFFARLKSGEIEVPYRRGISPSSQKLGQSWGVVAKPLEATVGTRVSYAPLVQSKADQTRYHKATGWVTAEDVKERHGERALVIVKEMLLRDL